MLFFPLVPMAFLLLPAIILAGIVYLVYRLGKKKKL
jgi:cbb3-type cytochrome oxidase subunit 3